jgi:hypothetical protein
MGKYTIKNKKTASKVGRSIKSKRPQQKKTHNMKSQIKDIKEMKQIWENAMEIDDETHGYELFEIYYNNEEGKAYIYCDTDDNNKYSESCKKLIKAAKTEHWVKFAKTKDFYPEIDNSYKGCFGIGSYTPNILKNSVDYALVDLDSPELALVSFCTVQYNLDINKEFTITVQQPNGIFMNSPIHYVWNVCKNNLRYKNVKGVCNVMMNKVLKVLKEYNNNSVIKNIPTFLNVSQDNDPAIKCYQRTGFSQLMYTPSTTRGLIGHIHHLIKLSYTPPGDILMYYSEANIKLVDKNNVPANVLPSNTERFALVCHGSIKNKIYELIDNKGTTVIKPLEEEYNFPIKKIGIFGFPGTILMAETEKPEDEKTIPSLICTSTLIPQEEHTLNNVNMTYILKSSSFGVNEDEDIKNGRNTFIGLWHCNRNTLVFDWNVLLHHQKMNQSMDLNTVFQYINSYTNTMNIPLSSVELNIFACRGYGLPNTPTTCVYIPPNFLGGSKTKSKVKASPIMVLNEPQNVITNIYSESPENIIRKTLEARDNYCNSTITKSNMSSRKKSNMSSRKKSKMDSRKKSNTTTRKVSYKKTM